MLLAGLFVLTVFAGQLLRVQAFDASAVANAAQERRLTTVTIPATRGEILDSNGVVLASSVERKTVTVDQTAVPTYERKMVVDGRKKDVTVGVVGAAQQLGRCSARPRQARHAADRHGPLPDPRQGHHPAGVAPDLRARHPRHLLRDDDPADLPEGPSTASVVGFTQADGTPASGVEFTERDALKGTPGKQVYQRGASGEPIPWAQEVDTPAQPGQNVSLTIDADLQWYAENQIASVVQSSGAISGYVVVMEVATGKLRAVASYPTFDPSNPGASTAFQRQNHAVEDVYEPGSTGKVMSIATALEEKKITPTTPLIVPNRLPGRGRRSRTTRTTPPSASPSPARSPCRATSARCSPPRASRPRTWRRRSASSASAPSPAPTCTASRPASSPRRATGAGRSATRRSSARATRSTRSRPPASTRPRQRRRARAADARREHDRARRHGHAGAAAAGRAGRLQQTATEMSQMLEEVVGPHGTAPKAKIDGYRVAGKTGTANRYDRRSAATAATPPRSSASRPPTPQVRRRRDAAEAGQRPLRRHPRRPRLPEGHVLPAPEAPDPPSGQAAPVIPLSSDTGWDPNDPAVLDGTKRKQ